MNLRARTDITIVSFSLASLLLVFLLIQPSFLRAKESGQNLLDSRQGSAAIEVQINNLESFRPRYDEEVKPNLEKSKKLLISAEDQMSFPVLMENVAAKNSLNINISSVRIFTEKEFPGESWPSLNYQIDLTGSFIGISKFIEEFSNLPDLIEIHGLDIKKDEQKENLATAKEPLAEGSQAQANFSLKVYMQKIK